MFFLIFFQKVFRICKFNFISSKFEFPNRLVWGCQSGLKLSSFAIRASNCDCSNLCSFPDMTFFVIFSKNFQKTFSSNFELSNPVVGSRQSTPRDCERSCLQLGLLKSFGCFRDMAFFFWFFF